MLRSIEAAVKQFSVREVDWPRLSQCGAAIAAGAIKSSKTTTLMTAAQGVEAMKKADDVVKVYRS